MRKRTGTLNLLMTEMRQELQVHLPGMSPDDLMNYAFMKDKLITHVISAEDNAARLRELPHRNMKDMAVICRFWLGEDERGSLLSIAVTKAMLEVYGICEKQLYADAQQAMREHRTYSIRPMDRVLSEMDPAFEEPMGPPGLYVAAMDTKLYGAGVITHPEFMEKAARIFNGDFFILPSSVHEVLLLQDDGCTDYRELQELVKTVNASFLDPGDKLTDNVYHYAAAEGLFETAGEYAWRMEKILIRNKFRYRV